MAIAIEMEYKDLLNDTSAFSRDEFESESEA